MQQANRIFSRLSEVEKVGIRSANIGRLEYLADTSHRSDMPDTPFEERVAVMTEVQALCALESSTKSAESGFGLTWKF